MAVKRHVRARSEEELEPVWSWIDDAEFSTAEVTWDRAGRTVAIPLTNRCGEPDFPTRQPAGRDVLNDYYFEPCFRATLTVHNIRAMRPEPRDLEEPGWIMGFEWHADRRVIDFDSPTAFEVEVDAFDVELTATDEIDHWHKAYYGRALGWEGAGPPIAGPPD